MSDHPKDWQIFLSEDAVGTDGTMSLDEIALWMQWCYTEATNLTQAGFFDGLFGNTRISEGREYINGFNFGTELRDLFKWWITIQEEMFPDKPTGETA